MDGVTGKPFSTQFTYSRFLVPYLMGYQGWAVFCDCDFLFRGSVDDLFEMADPHKAVQVVQHAHKPVEGRKMDGVVQSSYGRKNWSSLILFNCGHWANRMLLPVDAGADDGLNLHQFGWLTDDEIGALPVEWNYLVGHNTEKDCPDPKAVHFTEGGPWWAQYRDVPFADEWFREMQSFQHWEQ